MRGGATLLGLGLTSLVLVGCAATPVRVSIRGEALAASPLSTGTSGVSRQIQVPGAAGQRADWPGRESRRLVAPDTRRLLDEALAALRKNRQDAFEAALREFQREAEAALRRQNVQFREELEREQAALWASFLDEVRPRFLAHAEQEGPLRTELAARAGMPDPGPVREREGANPFAGPRRQEQIQAIREEIAESEGAFRAFLTQSLETYLAALAASDAKRQQAEAEAAGRAQAQALSRTQALLGDEAEPAVEVQRGTADLPARAGAQQAVPAGSARTWQGQSTPLPPESVPLRQAQARLFASERGYTLVPPGPGVRDVTEEFLEWRKERQSGRLDRSRCVWAQPWWGIPTSRCLARCRPEPPTRSG